LSSFDSAVEHIRREEGGLVDHPSDPGGRTIFGITQRTLDAARAAFPDLKLPDRVDDLTWPQAKEIYRRNYWQPIRGDELPAALALAVLDAAVNASPQRATRWLQQALRVAADGWLGAQTILAARRCDQPKTLREFHARRAHHYMLQDSTDDVFGLGWARRLINTHDAATKEIQ
jgi:lysozyme family protein